MLRVMMWWVVVVMLSACSDEGDRPFTTCPVVMPEDDTPCRTEGLLCFYAGHRLIDECISCIDTDWPCSEQTSECDGQHFTHIDRNPCDGAAGTSGM